MTYLLHAAYMLSMLSMVEGTLGSHEASDRPTVSNPTDPVRFRTWSLGRLGVFGCAGAAGPNGLTPGEGAGEFSNPAYGVIT